MRSSNANFGNLTFHVLKGKVREMVSVEITTQCLEALLRETHFVMQRTEEERLQATPPRRKKRIAAIAGSTPAAPRTITKAITYSMQKQAVIARIRQSDGTPAYKKFLVRVFGSRAEAHSEAEAWATSHHHAKTRKRKANASNRSNASSSASS